MPVDLWLLLPIFLVGAALYSSVGHGGATVYLAILTLAGYAVDLLAPLVLVLNLLVATVAFLFFRRAGHLRPHLLWPFLVTSVPAAYLGGAVGLGGRPQELILGIALALAALRFLLVPTAPDRAVPQRGRTFWVLAPTLGAVLGFLAGAVGIGGGIFLSPLLVLFGWADIKQAGAVAAAFIIVNSVAGLAARLPRSDIPLDLLAPLAAVVLVGALVGGFLGAERLPRRTMQVALGLVLTAASLKALFV